MSRFDHIAPEVTAVAPEPAPEAFGFEHYRALAERARASGEFERALRLFGRALERDRLRPEAWLGQVRALLEMGQPEEAETWLEQAAKVVGETPALLALRAVAANRRGRLEDARAWSDRAMRDGADDPEVWLARAEVVYAARNEKVARLNLDKAHERAPGADTARRCGEIALEYDDVPTARRWLERAALADPESALAALRLGVCWERAGDLSRARHELQRALLLQPELKSARLALSDLDSRGFWSRLLSRVRG